MSRKEKFWLSNITSCKISKWKLFSNNILLQMMAQEGSIVL